jgi:hypothetical protein
MHLASLLWEGARGDVVQSGQSLLWVFLGARKVEAVRPLLERAGESELHRQDAPKDCLDHLLSHAEQEQLEYILSQHSAGFAPSSVQKQLTWFAKRCLLTSSRDAVCNDAHQADLMLWWFQALQTQHGHSDDLWIWFWAKTQELRRSGDGEQSQLAQLLAAAGCPKDRTLSKRLVMGTDCESLRNLADSLPKLVRNDVLPLFDGNDAGDATDVYKPIPRAKKRPGTTGSSSLHRSDRVSAGGKPRSLVKSSIAKAPAKPCLQAPDKNSLVKTSSSTRAGELSAHAQLAESDPLYALLGELSANPIYEAGTLRADRLKEVFIRLWAGVAQSPKDWLDAWQAMRIPPDSQSDGLKEILNLGCACQDLERASIILSELVTSFKVKTSSMQRALKEMPLKEMLAVNKKALHMYPMYLVRLLPKPRGTGWGWSRVGWSWNAWWQYVTNCVQSLSLADAFDVIATILRFAQTNEGVPLGTKQDWLDGKLQIVVRTLSELAPCESADVLTRLQTFGVNTDGFPLG